jgi:hypothetical protein
MKVPILKCSHHIDILHSGYTIQQLWYFKTGSLIPLCYTYPIRTELEIIIYDQSIFKQWDHKEDDIISCPILIFIDGFGLYQNLYYSLIEVYAIVIGFTAKD